MGKLSKLHIVIMEVIKALPVPDSTKTLGPLGINEQALGKETEIRIFRI